MELDELENLSKNVFLPLISLIKQEQMDTANPEMDGREQLSTSASTLTDPASTSSTVNPCDSAEKRVNKYMFFK